MMSMFHSDLESARVPDSELRSMQFDRANRVLCLEMECATDRARLDICFEEIHGMIATNLSYQNVASDLRALGSEDLSDAEAKELASFIPFSMRPSNPSELIEHLDRSDLKAYCLCSSAGLELIVVCKRVLVRGGGESDIPQDDSKLVEDAIRKLRFWSGWPGLTLTCISLIAVLVMAVILILDILD